MVNFEGQGVVECKNWTETPVYTGGLLFTNVTSNNNCGGRGGVAVWTIIIGIVCGTIFLVCVVVTIVICKRNREVDKEWKKQIDI